MTFELVFIFVLIVAAMFLFAMENVPFDLVAVIIMASLMLSGILDLQEGFSGFSNPATITIAAMFALSEGVRRTGALRMISRYFDKIGELSFSAAMLVIMAIIGVISAFITNTAAVVIFIPVLMTTARKLNISPSKILLPLSFASMFGGVCTLLGTSTNILVSSIAVENGLPAFSMFEFAPFGLIIVAAGFIYLFVIGIRMVPPRRKLEDMTKSFQMNEYLFEVEIKEDNPFIGQTLEGIQQSWRYDLEVVQLRRQDTYPESFQDKGLKADDVLTIRGPAKEIDKIIRKQQGFKILPAREWKDANLSAENYRLVEAVVAPDSDFDSRRLGKINFFEDYGAVVLGLFKQGKPKNQALSGTVLRGGDSLLLALGADRTITLKNDPRFVIVSEIVLERFLTKRIPAAMGILAAVILAAALGIIPIALGAVTGVLLMIMTGCLQPSHVYNATNWKVIFLLAGVIPLGIAIETAGILEVGARPFLMAITFAASLSFITPWGYQTNTLIYGPGQYKFTDFTKVGLPLNILFWILGTIFIPLIWPF